MTEYRRFSFECRSSTLLGHSTGCITHRSSFTIPVQKGIHFLTQIPNRATWRQNQMTNSNFIHNHLNANKLGIYSKTLDVWRSSFISFFLYRKTWKFLTVALQEVWKGCVVIRLYIVSSKVPPEQVDGYWLLWTRDGRKKWKRLSRSLLQPFSRLARSRAVLEPDKVYESWALA